MSSKVPPELDAEIADLTRQIEELRNADDFDPKNMGQSITLSGLNVRLCSALMARALALGKDDLALKWSKEQQAWAQQRSRDTKLEKADRIRQLTRRVDLNDKRRKDFRDVKTRRNEQ